MQTLFDKVTAGALLPADAIDITLSLSYLIEDGHLTHLDPVGIGLDDDNQVSILPGTRPVDCCYAAPEVALDGAQPSQASMRFSLGCLLFFMLVGKSYYDAYDLDPIDLADTHPGQSMMDPSLYNGLAADAIQALTAWAPDARAAGMGCLLEIVASIPTRTTLEFTQNGNVVRTEELEHSETLHNYRSGEHIIGDDQVAYTILPGATVPFRPGCHKVTIPVTITSPETPRTPVERPAVIPADPVTQTPATPWLTVSFQHPTDSSRTIVSRVLPIDDADHSQMVPISLVYAAKYQFRSVKLNTETGAMSDLKDLYTIHIPAVPPLKRGWIRVSYRARQHACGLVVCSEDGRPIADGKYFQLK